MTEIYEGKLADMKKIVIGEFPDEHGESRGVRNINGHDQCHALNVSEYRCSYPGKGYETDIIRTKLCGAHKRLADKRSGHITLITRDKI